MIGKKSIRTTSLIVLYDPDSIQEENVEASMAFSWNDLNRNKAKHMELVAKRMGSQIHAIDDYFVDQEPLTPILVMAVDSLAARKNIWEATKDQYEFYVDMRTGYALSAVYTWKRGEVSDQWIESLDMPEIEVPCGAKAVAHNCLIPAAIAAGAINNYSKELPVDMEYSFFDLNTMMGERRVRVAGEYM